MNIVISNENDLPLYQQIATQVKKNILTKKISTGDTLPSIRMLANNLQISQITIRRAYEELEREGYVISKVGQGTFVNLQNNELLYEKGVQMVQAKLSDALSVASSIEMSHEEVLKLLRSIISNIWKYILNKKIHGGRLWELQYVMTKNIF